jgi:hypothetical protein
MAFTTTQGSRVLRFLVPAVLLVSFFFIVNQLGSDTWKGSASDYARLPESLSRGGSKAPEPKPANATLDFQEIIYLSLPYRTDRQDALSLIAAVSGLKLTMLPGVCYHRRYTPYPAYSLTHVAQSRLWLTKFIPKLCQAVLEAKT